MISRRDLFKGAMATGLSGLFLSGCSQTGDVPQTPFSLLDPDDTNEFLTQTIRAARQTFIGSALYDMFREQGHGRVLMARAGDPQMSNLEAAYSGETKNILFRHPDDVRRTMQNMCQDGLRSGYITQDGLAHCADLREILIAQRLRTPQAGILVHELTHAAQDQCNLTNMSLYSLIRTTSPDARKIYFLNEIMGDVLALRFHVEYVQYAPDKELATIQNLLTAGLSPDFYALMRHAEQFRDKDESQRLNGYRTIINLLIATGRYQSYEERVDRIITEFRRDVAETELASQITNDDFDYYCSVSNALLACEGVLTKDFIQSLDFSRDQNINYDVPQAEVERINRLFDNNQAMVDNWSKNLGIAGASSAPITAPLSGRSTAP